MALRPCIVALLASTAIGCAFDTDSDFAVVPSWAINGLAPTAEECRAFGVDHVEFRLTRPKSSRVITAPCDGAVEYDDGYDVFELGGFVTTAHFEYGKTYDYEVSLVNASGQVVHGARAAGSFRVTADDAVPWLLDPVEIFAPEGNVASYSAAWTVGGTLAEGCAALGISEVALDITTDFDVDLSHMVELARAPCEAGTIVAAMPELAFGRYIVRYVALAANGALVDQTDFVLAVVDAPGELKFDVARFDGIIEAP